MTMIDRVSERDQGMVLKLAGVLTRKGFITSEHVNEALAPLMSEFGDLALDYPHAPKLFGTLIGALISDGVYPLTSFPALLLPVEDARVRRDLALYALNFMRSRTEDAKIGAMFREHGIAGAAFLSHDPQFDGDMPEVSDWLKENDLAFIPA